MMSAAPPALAELGRATRAGRRAGGVLRRSGVPASRFESFTIRHELPPYEPTVVVVLDDPVLFEAVIPPRGPVGGAVGGCPPPLSSGPPPRSLIGQRKTMRMF